MNLIESLLGYRPFSSGLEIRESIMKSRGRDAPSEPLDDTNSLLIFETSRQHTWLVATSDSLYFVLDDIRMPEPQIKRAVRRHELKARDDGTVAVDTRSKSTSTGLVDVGLRRRGWLYSKGLFSSQRPIEQAINELLRATDRSPIAGHDRTGVATAGSSA